MRFILLFLSYCFQLRHHRIATGCEHIYSFVPHSYAFCILLMLLDFYPFESSKLLSSFEIFIQVLPSILSFCVRDILLSAHGRRRTFEQSYPTDFIQYVFWCMLSFWEIWLFWPFGIHLWHGIILNTIQLFTLLPFHGYFVVSFLGQTLVWSEWSLKIVLCTFLTLVIL